ncbi:MAG: Bro-N domain-containing protein [Proteobacteria bacterium]|nr:Bro-N domain-containing protein [Pseudomonadota bacterium]MBU1688293.1 Bro-N domain-containing protein [Pseudomonadota bacterium]
MENKLVVFKGKEIRRIFHNNEWWFSVIDVVGVLSDSNNPKRYWSDLKRKLEQEAGSEQPYEKIVRFKLLASDGKKRETDCAETATLFRVIQSIPSPKAEPFKRWLAKVGYERVQEIEDPGLATKRTKALYRAKGYSEAWIEKRMRGIAVRAELTDEWQNRGIKEDPEYAILTSEISKAAFGLTPSEYKNLKGLERENLRDHMTDLELIFSMLGEAATTEIARKQNAQGFGENKVAAHKGGKISGDARKKLEVETGDKVVSPENYLIEPESKKRLQGRK